MSKNTLTIPYYSELDRCLMEIWKSSSIYNDKDWEEFLFYLDPNIADVTNSSRDQLTTFEFKRSDYIPIFILRFI